MLYNIFFVKNYDKLKIIDNFAARFQVNYKISNNPEYQT